MRVALMRAVLLVVLILAALPAMAATRRVPSEYATINRAMDAAAAGDTVLVAPGTYDEYETRIGETGALGSSVAFLRAGTVLLSEAGASATTLRMDATVGFPTIVEDYGEPGDFVVRGFSLTGTVPDLSAMSFTFTGRAVVEDCTFHDFGSGGSGDGALSSTMADLEVRGCRFLNINGGSGSAIAQASSTLLVEDSEFSNCRSGAISVRREPLGPHEMGLTVRRCRFVGNVKTTGGGGAVYTQQYPTVLIEDSWFESNESIEGSQAGGAIALTGVVSHHEVRGCTFVENNAGNGLGGAAYISCLSSTIEGNTFFANRVGLDWPEGGSAVFFADGAGTLRNNLMVANTGDHAAGRATGTVVTSSCNVYWANAVGNASGFPMDETDLEADPQFCDATTFDFTVNETSPCLPANGHPACSELIGAWGQGCGVISVNPESWGRLKSSFRAGKGVNR